MKKIYLTGVVFFAGIILVLAQSGGAFFNEHPVNINGHETNFKRAKTSLTVKDHQDTRSLKSIMVDYDGQEALRVDTNYSYFVWDMNNNYANTATSSSQKYCVVAFDSLFDTNLGVGFNPANVLSVNIDSVFAIFGHQNKSGKNDTITVSVIPVNAAGYPQVSAAALWSDQLITSTGLSTGNDWLGNPYLYSKEANYALAAGTKKFAVMLQYKGDIKDTMAFYAGFEKTTGTCGSSAYSVQHPSQFFTTASSKHNANSYALWAAYTANGILPTSSGGDIYYDCDGNSKPTYPPDGYSYIQNITIWVKLTIDDVSGINEQTNGTGLKLQQNYPNPARGAVTSIGYDITQPASVSISISDLTGKKLVELNEGKQATGNHTVKLDVSSLANGMYFYTLTAGADKMTKQLVIQK